MIPCAIIALTANLLISALSYQQLIDYNPMKQMEILTITHSLIKYLYQLDHLTSDSQIPQMPILKINPTSYFNCLLCDKKFKNESYLSLHYVMSHMHILNPNSIPQNPFSSINEGPFNPYTLHTLFSLSSSNISPIEQKILYPSTTYHNSKQRKDKLSYCKQWFLQLRKHIYKRGVDKEGKFMCFQGCENQQKDKQYPQEYAYVLQNSSDEFCLIVVDQLYLQDRLLFVKKIVGVILILIICFALLLHQDNKKSQLKKKRIKRD